MITKLCDDKKLVGLVNYYTSSPTGYHTNDGISVTHTEISHSRLTMLLKHYKEAKKDSGTNAEWFITALMLNAKITPIEYENLAKKVIATSLVETNCLALSKESPTPSLVKYLVDREIKENGGLSTILEAPDCSRTTLNENIIKDRVKKIILNTYKANKSLLGKMKCSSGLVFAAAINGENYKVFKHLSDCQNLRNIEDDYRKDELCSGIKEEYIKDIKDIKLINSFNMNFIIPFNKSKPQDKLCLIKKPEVDKESESEI